MSNRLDAAVALIAARHHGIFAIHHLDELGVSRQVRQRRIAAGRWEPAYDCAYRIAGVPRTWHGDLLAACWAGGTRAMASHRSAAALWELPSGRTDRLELTCPRWRRARHADLLVHESTLIDDADAALVINIPCTSAARTLFDLARVLSPVMLDANMDSALRRGLVSIEQLEATVCRLATRGRPGGSRFRAVVAGRTAGAASPESVPERLLARALVQQGLPEPVSQFIVRTSSGEFVARVDLAYPESRILIEYDSYQEHTGKVALVRDSARRNALTELGFTVLTATAADLADHACRLATSIRMVRRRAA